MKKIFATIAIAALAASAAVAQSTDSLKMKSLNEVVVLGVKAQKNAPFAVSNVNAKKISDFAKTGVELPFLFAQTPGVLAWGENGIGTGTSYMRIRGAAGSRINVTLDGVALNSPEDQCVFWANMNSYATLLGGIQIQRGVGTSTNGDGAFGGTVMLQTKTPMERPSLELTGSYGSFNTFNVGANFSTGLLWNHLIFDGAYHETNTDGYIHGTAGRSGSYYGGLTWYNSARTLRLSYKNIGNFEKTGQAWNGIETGSLFNGTYGAQTGIYTYQDMYNAGLGKFNTLYERNTGKKDANGNYITERYKMNDGSLWDKTTDNFWQNHNILSLAYQFNEKWSISAAAHYTYGYGYYKEFRFDNKLKKFGINAIDGDPATTDFVRKKGLEQNAGGFNWNVNYKDTRWDVVAGMTFQQFEGNHFGYLTYIADKGLDQRLRKDGDYKYYDSDASKGDLSTFVKATFHLAPSFDIFGDVQYRHVNYITDGVNDKFLKVNKQYVNQVLNINEEYNFLNPKFGLSYHNGPHKAYASVAISNREPERNNFTDNGNGELPKAERLYDYELGYSFTTPKFHIGANIYYMDYKNQFVQTGRLSDIGEKLTTNIDKSYRMGVELTAGWNVLPCLSIEGNAALSENKLKDFTEHVEDWENWDTGEYDVYYDKTTIAFSPSAILNGFINFHWKGIQAIWHTNFVSRQYLDNSQNKERSLPSYSQTNVNLSYTLGLDKKFAGLREVVFGCSLNNIFNKHYAASGWVYSAISEKDYGHTNTNRYTEIGFMPMAGFHAMGSVTLKF